MTDSPHRPKPHTTPARVPEVVRTSDIWRLADSLAPHSPEAYRLRALRWMPGPWPVAEVVRAVGLCRVLKIIADRPTPQPDKVTP